MLIFVFFMVPTVMESHGILASHGNSWKVMENGESLGKVMEF